MKLDRVIAVRNDKTVYRDGDRVIKVFHAGYSKADVLNEALNQARIEETGLRIPKVLEVTVIDGKWSIVYEFIKGKTLVQRMAENPGKKDEYIALLVELQRSVHRETVPLLNRLQDTMRRKIDAAGLDETTRCGLLTRLEGMPRHDKVCHGDFNPTNVIIAMDGTPYLLDWSHATRGNASADVACTYLKLRMNGDEAGAELYLDTFCQKSNTDKQYVQKWIPLVAASQLAKANEKERAFIAVWVKVEDAL